MNTTQTTGLSTTLQPVSSRTRRVIKITLIVLTILWVLLLIPAGMFALLSPFAFDNGVTDEAFQVFYILISFPFVLLFSPIIAWILYRLKLDLPAVIIALLP